VSLVELADRVNAVCRLRGRFVLRSGARVHHALCVIDRQEGGTQSLAAEGITLRALLTRADLDAAAAR